MSKKAVKFTRHHRAYNSGETATFRKAEADKLISMGVAKPLSTAPKKPAEDRSLASPKPKTGGTRQELIDEARRKEFEGVHHNTLRAHVEAVAEAYNFDPPESRSADVSKDFLVDHWDKLEELGRLLGDSE